MVDVRRALVAACLGAGLAACRSGEGSVGSLSAGYLDAGNYAYAVYDGDDLLVHSPIERLRADLDDRDRLDPRTNEAERAISDVYVLVHGWNYTVEESFGLYEADRRELGRFVEKVQEHDPDFQPYFVFVVWNSVSRPLTSGLKSICPVDPLARWLSWLTRPVDDVVFYVPSAWGESRHAYRIAVQGTEYDLDGERDSATVAAAPFDYHEARAAAGGAAAGGAGCKAPLGVLLDEIVRARLARSPDRRPNLHVVGHSFGGKCASLAAHDAVQRWLARECLVGGGAAPDTETSPLIDSLVLLLPAMTAVEAYQPLRFEVADDVLARDRARGDGALLTELSHAEPGWLAQKLGWRPPVTIRPEAASARIGTKVLVHSPHDVANGWVFGTSDLVLPHGAVQQFQAVGGDDVSGVVQAYMGVVGTAVASAISAPLSVAGGVESTFRGDPGAEEKGLGEKARSVVNKAFRLPLAASFDRASVGNVGLRRPTADFLGGVELPHEQRGSVRFVCASRGLRPKLPAAERRTDWITYNARRVYDGATAHRWSWLSLVPPGAHGDLRCGQPLDVSVDEDPDHAPEIVLDPLASRRMRTFQFVYNVTRGLPGRATGPADAAPLPAPRAALPRAAD